MEGARVGGTIPKEGYRNATFAFELGSQTGTGYDGNTTGNDAVGSQHTDAKIGDVHGAAFAFAVAGLSAVQFSHHPIQIGTLGETVPVTAVGADDLVVPVQC